MDAKSICLVKNMGHFVEYCKIIVIIAYKAIKSYQMEYCKDGCAGGIILFADECL